ncbi:DUF748 domain-containing protein [Anthocerotibacter panamensis]|uniref:DUF748 domain-containing protein n=1 Tax=Anthocerotibacter panamensis TaxID=2857077 RepID=UPI001C402223|nr:AsmA-like C-terminal region-containing protein [Anthocerotibacter panamensis]
MTKTSSSWTPGQTLRIALGVVLVLIALTLLSLTYTLVTLEPNQWRVPLEQALQESTGRKFELGRLRLSTFEGVGVRTDRVLMRDENNQVEGQARDILIEMDLLPLLWQRFQVRAITLDRLTLRVERDRQGHWSIGDLLTRPVQSEGLTINPTTTTLQLTRANVRIKDHSTTPARDYQLRNLDLRLEGVQGDQEPRPISLQGSLIQDVQNQETVVALEGKVHLPNAQERPEGDLQILVAGLQSQAWEFYWRPWLQSLGVQGLLGLSAGRLDLDLRWKGQNNGDYQLTGRVGAKGVQWPWPQVWGSKPWITPTLIAQVNISQEGGHWRVNPTTVTLGEMAVTAQGSLDATNLDLQVTSNDFDPYKVRDRLPLSLVPKPLKHWLVTSTGQGKLRFSAQTQGTLQNLTSTGTVTLLGLGLKTTTMDGNIDHLTGQLVFDQPGHMRFDKVELGLGKTSCLVTGELVDSQWQLLLKAQGLDLERLTGISSAFFPKFVGQWRGKGDLEGTLSGPLANPTFVGALKLNQAQFRDSALPRPITQVTGSLKFTPGLLTLMDIKGLVDGSPLTLTGTVTNLGLANTQPNLTLQGESLDLSTVRALVSSSLVSPALRKASTFLTQLSGVARGSLTVQGPRLEGQLQLSGATVGLAPLAIPLTGVSGIALFTDGNIAFQNLKGNAAGSDFQFDGSVLDVVEVATVQGVLRGQLAFPSVFKLLPLGVASGLQAEGSAPFTLTFTPQGTSTLVQGEGNFATVSQLRLSSLDFGGTTPRRGTLTALAGPNTLEIQGANLDLLGSALEVSGTIRRWQTSAASFQLELSSDPQPLTSLAITLPWVSELTAFAQGQGRINLSLEGTPQRSAWSGGVRLKDVQIPLLGGLTVSGTLGRQDATLRAWDLSMLWRGEPIRIVTGTYTPGPTPQVSFKAQASTLDLTRLLVDYAQAEPLRSWRGAGELTVGSTSLSGLPLNNFKTTLTLLQTGVRLDPLQANTSRGTLQGSLTADLTAAAPRYTGRWSLSGVSLGQISSALLGWGDEELGTGSLQFSFEGQGANARQFLNSLQGEGTLASTGTFKWLALLARATGDNAFAAGAQVTGPFLFSEGMLRLSEGKVTTTPGSSDPWQGTATGQLNLGSGQAEIEGRLSHLLQTFQVRLKGLLTDGSPGVVQEVKR